MFKYPKLAELRAQLKNNTVSEQAQYYYLVNIFAVYAFFPLVMYGITKGLKVPFTVAEFGALCLALLSVLMLGFDAVYRENNRGDGKLYLPRVICLLSHVQRYSMTILFIAWFVASALDIGTSYHAVVGPSVIIITCGWWIVAFWWVRKQIRLISRGA